MAIIVGLVPLILPPAFIVGLVPLITLPLPGLWALYLSSLSHHFGLCTFDRLARTGAIIPFRLVPPLGPCSFGFVACWWPCSHPSCCFWACFLVVACATALCSCGLLGC